MKAVHVDHQPVRQFNKVLFLSLQFPLCLSHIMQQAVVKFLQLFLFAFDDVISFAGVAVIYRISLCVPFALRETQHT